MRRIDEFYQLLEKTPIIPGIKDPSQVQVALEKRLGILFCLTGTIFDLIDIAKEVEGRDVMLFAHVDLLAGIGKDTAGMKFLAEHVEIAGILSTRSHLLRSAKKQGLLTIQRVFAVDSDAVKTGIQVVQNTSPAAIEILPGPVAPAIVSRLPNQDFPPVIAGGLIDSAEKIHEITSTPGIVSISASDPSLWGTLT